MPKMTNKEIKKGLEICCDDNYNYRCCGCPYNSVRHCNDALENDARELIIKQEQEIAELKAAKNDWKQRYESLDQRYVALVASSVECIDKKVKKAKTDVLNELKDKYGFYSCYSWHCDTKLLSEIIDELIKEVQNAEDKS